VSSAADEILRQLLPIDATSGREAEVARQLEALLEERGYAVHRVVVGDPADGRWNVLATTEAAQVLLSTHMDTVPPHLPHREDDEAFWGRGACDAKGCAASMIAAADRLRADQVPHGLLFVVGEETTSDGAKAAARVLPDRVPGLRFIVDGEPTDCRWVRGSLGVLAGALRATGRAAHSAYPERGHSALHDLIPVLDRWLSEPLPTDDDFGPTYLNVGKVEGGSAANVLAAEAEALILARCTVPHQRVLELLTARLPEGLHWSTRSASDPQHMVLPPWVRPADSIVVRFGSDVPFLSAAADCLMLGPGSIEVAHSVNEHVAKAELATATDEYERVVRALAEAP
jgi:acetylornithine deacetylase